MAEIIEVKVPDIGDYSDVPVIEVHVKVGDVVQEEQSLVTLESDKASMEVPSSHAGTVKEMRLSLGDKVSKGTIVLLLETIAVSQKESTPKETVVQKEAVKEVILEKKETVQPVSIPSPVVVEERESGSQKSHASPSVRKYARELGVEIGKVKGTGPKGRVTYEDVKQFVKSILTGSSQPTNTGSLGGLNLLPLPKIDFSKFGSIERKPLTRIQKLSSANLARNWVVIPGVTYHEDADITELESFRISTNKKHEKEAIKITMLSFIIKASVSALQQYPEFNSSLDGDELVLKKYFHIGFAADTPNGLVVPVLKNADKKGILEISKEVAELAKLAREGKLKPDQMQGASFTISSLGGIGGTYFSPIINAPEVAILGVSKASMKPIWNGKEFEPRLMLPLSLTADHRVIDGALGTRFNAYIAELLSDFRKVVL